MRGCSGGVRAWFSGGMHGFLGGGMHGFFDEIRSMSGRYTSYWNAFLSVILSGDFIPSGEYIYLSKLFTTYILSFLNKHVILLNTSDPLEKNY